MNYYNDNDPKCCAWLRELIKAELIPAGEVDGRSILEIKPAELEAFTQCHFFAGIGGWAYALRLAGWHEDRPVWTGSCPCQPLSCAGKRRGEKDERHLWPEFYRLISERRPATIFGEQVGSKDGVEWLDGVSLDLEELGYAVGSSDLPAAGVGAPHRRQRLYWMAHTERDAGEPGRITIESRESIGESYKRASKEFGRCSVSSGMAESDGGESGEGYLQRSGEHGQQQEDDSSSDRLEHAESDRRKQRRPEASERSLIGGCGTDGPGNAESPRTLSEKQPRQPYGSFSPSPAFWNDFDLISCADGKSRRVKSGLQCLAHGIQRRVGLLRGFGNAIVPQCAAEFIQAAEEAISHAPSHP